MEKIYHESAKGIVRIASNAKIAKDRRN